MTSGTQIVLTASKAEMSQFGPEIGDAADGFLAMLATFPDACVRPAVKKYLVPVGDKARPAQFAPYSLRKIEAALAGRYGPDRVVVCHPDGLANFVGPATRIVGVTTMDPLGLGYVSATYNSLFPFGEDALVAHEFRHLLRTLAALKTKFGFRIVVGGEGTWQIDRSGLREAFGIDTLVHGRPGGELGTVMDKVMAGEAAEVLKFKNAGAGDGENAPLISAPAIYGDVEITRGCGRGCAFCSPNLSRHRSVPVEDVLREVEVNIRGGSESVFVITDDVFLYGSDGGFRTNRKAVVGLFEKIAAFPGVRWIHLSHASLAPALTDPALVAELAPILVEKSSRWVRKKKYAAVEVGIETGSAEIMRKYMPGKALPLNVNDWPGIVLESIARLNASDIFPVGTIVVGWPDETERDAAETVKLIEALHDQRARLFYTPVVFIPIEGTPLGRKRGADLASLGEAQRETIVRSWRYNVELWGTEAPKPLIRFVGLGARAFGLWRRIRGSKTAGLQHALGNVFLKTRIPCEPWICR